ncbi:hypothetical protein VNO78_08505 [Psophocarpus tetragonolobus]|uniref:Uncharacterized protein n=1 Tax=Psophocarpus tetragonolobus TaxID=3891 RepID=A0AAN9XSY4_PSOTE
MRESEGVRRDGREREEVWRVVNRGRPRRDMHSGNIGNGRAVQMQGRSSENLDKLANISQGAGLKNQDKEATTSYVNVVKSPRGVIKFKDDAAGRFFKVPTYNFSYKRNHLRHPALAALGSSIRY